MKDLRKRVLTPLGDEAAVATTGRHVFIRHHAIARTAVELLSEKLSIDLDAIYERLEASALFVGLSGTFVPNFNQWRYLGSHFFEKGDTVLGIELARMAMTTDPGNPFVIDKLSKMYRGLWKH